MSPENSIVKDKNILLVLPSSENETDDLNYLVENFCGSVIKNYSSLIIPFSYLRNCY
jgi:hypothetical protein